MDWLDKIKEYAPEIALAIATGGTGAIATTAISIAAREMGVKKKVTSTAQLQQIVEKASPDMLLKLKKAEYEFAIGMQQLASKDMETVNKTMQIEATSGDAWQRRWRPFWGFASGAAFVFVSLLVCYLGYEAVISKNVAALTMIPQLVGSFATLFAIPGAILGVSAWHRGKEKVVYAEAKLKQEEHSK